MTVPTVQTQSPDRPVAWKRMVLDQRSRLFWLALTLVGVGWALAFARDTKYSAHQIWGSLAVVGYGLAALAAMTLPRR